MHYRKTVSLSARRLGRPALRGCFLAAASTALLSLSACGGSSPDIDTRTSVDTRAARVSDEQARDRNVSTLAKYGVAGSGLNQIPLSSAAQASIPDLPAQVLAETSHKRLYKTYTDLVPDFARRNVAEFWVFTDGPTGKDAFVEIDKSGYRQFALGIDAMNALPISDPSGTSLAQALIHEQGHLLSLGGEQIDYSPTALKAVRTRNAAGIDAAITACAGRTFMLEGCAKSSSYLDRFAQQFWGGDLQKWYASIKQGQPQMSGLFNQRPGAFVSYYAATNPGEDFAETWLRFVTGAEVTAPASIAEQKIAFFQSHPTLVRARNEIRARYKQRY